MNDSVLVEALRARDPGALAALYDSYAESIYRYAWAVLGSSDSAQVALRDTLIAAEAHVHALADPERLRVWLYALARGECVRRRSVIPAADGGQGPPGAPAAPEPPDGDLRLVAANAVGALSDDEREILDLLTRHSIPEAELGAVLGITSAQADQLRQSACDRLQDLVTTEILARNASHDCAGRAGILDGFSGSLDQETRERLLAHIEHCAVCAPHRERQVSAVKVFNLLPHPPLPETLRVRVMSCFIDPELVPYRRYVARRTGLLDSEGFPIRETKGSRRWPQVLAGAVAALAVGVAAIVLVSAVRQAEDPLSRSAYDALPVPQGSSTGGTPASPTPTTPSPPLTPVVDGFPSLPAVTPGFALPIAVVRPDARLGGPPAPMPTVSSTPSAPVPTPKPVPSSATPTPRPTEVVPPVTTPAPTPPPATPSPPPPSVRPTPTASHQHDPVPTPCPSRTRTPRATPSPPRAGTPPPAPSPSSARRHTDHTASEDHHRAPRADGFPRRRPADARERHDSAGRPQVPVETPTESPADSVHRR
jgi:DNA-directed RNA polymerase specialized sigma24 family protein